MIDESQRQDYIALFQKLLAWAEAGELDEDEMSGFYLDDWGNSVTLDGVLRREVKGKKL